MSESWPRQPDGALKPVDEMTPEEVQSVMSELIRLVTRWSRRGEPFRGDVRALVAAVTAPAVPRAALARAIRALSTTEGVALAAAAWNLGPEDAHTVAQMAHERFF